MTARPEHHRIVVGEWLVDPALNQISRGGQTHRLEPRRMGVLLALAARPGELVTTDELLETVWKGVIVTQSSLYQNIAHLRRLLGDESDEPTYIETISRKGYRLIARVSNAGVESQQTAAGNSRGSPVLPDTGRRRTPWLRWGIIGLVAAIGVLLWVSPAWRLTPWWQGSELPPSMAVLPFQDASDSQADQLYADGLSEALLERLARVPGLRVAARTSSFAHRDGALAPVSFARDLGVSHLLKGNVRRTPENVRVDATLIDARAGRDLWTRTYRGDAADAGRLQTQLARDIIEALRIPPGPQVERVLTHQGSANIDANDLYLLGMANVAVRTPEKIAKARDYFRTATDLDPKFAPAYVGLARTFIQDYYYSNLPLRETVARAQPLLDRALALDELSAEAYANQGLLRSELLELRAAEEDLKRAIALNPNYADAYFWLGLVAAQDGRPLDALREHRKALALDPLNFIILVRLGLESGSAGEFEQADGYLARAAELAPQHPNAPWGTAFNHMLRGQLDEAVAGYRRAIALDPNRQIFRTQLGWVLLDLGRLPEAAESFATAATLAGAELDAQIDGAYVAVAAQSPAEVAAYLDARNLQRSESVEMLLDVAFLEHLAGRNALAMKLYGDALPLALTRPTVLADPWDIRWGRSDVLDAACVHVGARRGQVAAPLFAQVEAAIDRLERNGNVWSGLAYTRARILTPRGAHDAALRELTRAYDRGWRRSWWMRADPCLMPLRQNAAFKDLLERIDRDIVAMNAEEP